MRKVQLCLNYAGYCLSKESHAIEGGKNRSIKFHALFGLIRHPDEGWILFDTGYTPEFYHATRYFPNKIYALATKVHISAKETVAAQLRQHQISPDEIGHIIISHFHADHIGGLKDFPNAHFYCTERAYEEVLQINKTWAFRKGILPSLIPEDFESRVIFVEEIAMLSNHPILGKQYDLFRDQSLMLYDLPGHARGQLGLRIRTEKKEYFLIADACWLKKSYEEMVLPNPIVRLFFDSWKEFKTTLQKIHQFHQSHPSAVIVPTHCEATTTVLVSNKLNLDAL
jgi:glyoxylase-like metal-dependent hydrolase (beta-lactamase superfamily II)